MEFLKTTHPTWDRYHEEWGRRERLLRGGLEVVETELERFIWEEKTGDHYKNRMAQAVYPGFGEAFLHTLVGHVLRDRPEVDGDLSFGAMGKVERVAGSEPSQAEQVFFNVNGTGGDGQQFWQWIAGVFQRAGATGIRWVMTESPPWTSAAQPTRADEIRGRRPYAVEFSPRLVTNWKIDRGQLQWCIVRIRQDTRKLVGEKVEGSANEEGYYLLVRQGFEQLGERFKGGGWWKFDKDLKPVADNGEGTWDKTAGEIPMSLAVWEWESEPSDENPLPLGRSATTSLDNLSVAYRNIVSAWRSNMWRSAGGPTYLLGVSSEAMTIAKAQWQEGTSLMGVPASQAGVVPSIGHSSAAAVSSQAFAALLEHMTAEGERMMVQLATSTPDSSGRSKEAGFSESKGPRLTMLAENIESFINTTLRFFELRFGATKPQAYVKMPREFDLLPVEEDIRDFFETFRRSMLRSATLESEAMVRLAEAKGLVNDENREVVKTELADSAKSSATSGLQEGDFLGSLFGGNGNGGGAPPKTDPALVEA
jgi:hypothetical protein